MTVKIYFLCQNEQIIAQSIHVLLHLFTHGSDLSQRSNPTLSTATHRAGYMALGGRLTTAWKHEALSFGQKSHDLIDL